MTDPMTVTRLLHAWRAGEQGALDDLVPLVYEELRRIAKRAMRAERSSHTLQATALVHEAYARMVDADIGWEDRSHFFAVAARSMRRILVDHARARARGKRNYGATELTLHEEQVAGAPSAVDLMELDEVLTRLEAIDERKCRVVELHFFAGMTYDETAAALGLSPATVDRELRLGKAWLYRELTAGGEDG